jgi:hypothetical protein
LREKLSLLIELQKMESAAGRIAARKRDLPIQMAELETKFNGCSAAVENQHEQLEALRKSKKEKDKLLQTGQETLKRTRERLFEVKTNKEYQSMLKEIETLEGKNSHLEDEVIALLEELDAFEKEMKAKETDLTELHCSYEKDKAQMTQELDSLAQEMVHCVKKGEELRKLIPADMLRKYQQVKNATRGTVVVPVWKEICGGCHMSIPPQLYNELQKCNGIITCPNCNRIMYWDNMNGRGSVPGETSAGQG